MTKGQRLGFYFPTWNKVCRVHGWKSRLRGQELLATRRDSWGSPEVDALYRKVWFIALGLADREDRDVTITDLRHACSQMVNPSLVHSADLNNTETNRVVALFDLLADPDDLNAMTKWLYPENAAKAGLIVSIKRKAPLAYYTAIAKDKFGEGAIDDLDEKQLRQLLATVTARMAKKRKVA